MHEYHLNVGQGEGNKQHLYVVQSAHPLGQCALQIAGLILDEGLSDEQREDLRHTAAAHVSTRKVAPAPLERLATAVLDAVNRDGGLWPAAEIRDKIVEELGELFRACRKGSPREQLEELGDLAFAVYCLTLRENTDFDSLLRETIAKHIRRTSHTHAPT